MTSKLTPKERERIFGKVSKGKRIIMRFTGYCPSCDYEYQSGDPEETDVKLINHMKREHRKINDFVVMVMANRVKVSTNQRAIRLASNLARELK